MDKISLSALPHSWLIDLDGTIFEHNAHISGKDKILPGVKKFFQSIPLNDKIIILTARTSEYSAITERGLREHGLRYDQIIFDMPVGERVLINDIKPKGLETAKSINVIRDQGLESIEFEIYPSLYK